MNRLLIPTVAFVALLMAGCENWDVPDLQKNTSDQGTAPGTAPAASDPSPLQRVRNRCSDHLGVVME